MDTTAPERLVVMSVCRRWDAGVSRAFGHQPPGRRCRLLNCQRRNAAVTRWTSGRGPPGCRSVLVGTPPSAAAILLFRPLRYVNFCLILVIRLSPRHFADPLF